MNISIFGTPLILLLFGLGCYFFNQMLHKRRVLNGADPLSTNVSCMMTLIAGFIVGAVLFIIWLNMNWTG
jgi:hypothetical protein